ncbi:MAG: pseudouridine synthase [Victivallaceae bacterium]|jgi:23S rRNA pseudouridine2605 synthase|nr:pseudouridine synthase [Victivallaceae bacterium]MDD3702842.1 pseudouridine synthase [Victivallaceae bacterium]MDD4318408.1 pseudouridine synthase [Victivallaceae bacterium]
MTEKMRLVKFLAAAGIASRRKAADLIAAGMVTVNGKPPLGPGDPVGADDTVSYNGVPITQNPLHYLILNKPLGYTCTNFDRHAEKTVFELIDLPNAPKLFSAGRLDKESEGLLIITNDGDYAAKLMHPRYEILKTYIVKTSRPIPHSELERLRGGIVDDGEHLCPRRIDEISPGQYRFILNEGKKREIRRLVRAAGARTEQLQRIQIGQLKLGNLQIGKWRKLTAEEIQATLHN